MLRPRLSTQKVCGARSSREGLFIRKCSFYNRGRSRRAQLQGGWPFLVIESMCAAPRTSKSFARSLEASHRREYTARACFFLKAEAWKINAGVSVISDLDTQIINGRYVADFLISFARNGKCRHMLEECGGALMCRTKSKMRFGESYDPQVVRPLETNKKKRGRMV